ncbi:MAG: Gfo/Idh/MocA family oxidoreductase [Acidobacteria bacterium]|nr:Gfo/Idh/MocA family oxidoreductase [Acidobacteriota bacterium]
MDSTDRRRFLGGLAAASVARAAQNIRIGLIGCGWYGMVDLNAALKAGGVDVAGLCDIDSEHLAKAAGEVEKAQGRRPKLFKKYQELLDEPGLNAVIIATPPHWHALPFLAACRKGLDIYCEKPLAYDIREGRAMVEAARAAGRVVQIGFQRRHAAAIGQAAEYIRAGNAGKIVQVEANIHFQAGTPDPTPQPPPASLDWETWCGPAPKLPYSPAIGHKSWRLEAAYGNGHLVDWGIHLIDAVRWTLGESMPRAVYASGALYVLQGKITTPDTLTVQFEFATCPVVWRHRIWGAGEANPEFNNGIFFYGARETLLVSDSRWVVIPRGKGERRVTQVKSEAGPLHMANFLDAVRARKQAACVPEDGYRSTATVQLAMISYRTRSRVEWDAAREQIPGNAAAAALLKRDYRPPYRHPYQG